MKISFFLNIWENVMLKKPLAVQVSSSGQCVDTIKV
jgi:hypothetical protein